MKILENEYKKVKSIIKMANKQKKEIEKNYGMHLENRKKK